MTSTNRQNEWQVPVDTPQLRRHALFGGTAGSTFTTWAMSTTVYSVKLETDRKWCIVSPLRSLNLLVWYLGIQGETLKGNIEHRLLFFDLQSAHSIQSARKCGMTMSPSATSITFSPTLSTILQHNVNWLEPIVSRALRWLCINKSKTSHSSLTIQLARGKAVHYLHIMIGCQ